MIKTSALIAWQVDRIKDVRKYHRSSSSIMHNNNVVIYISNISLVKEEVAVLLMAQVHLNNN
jgi:hypothetical protein